jgi:hypothetical protein
MIILPEYTGLRSREFGLGFGIYPVSAELVAVVGLGIE